MNGRGATAKRRRVEENFAGGVDTGGRVPYIPLPLRRTAATPGRTGGFFEGSRYQRVDGSRTGWNKPQGPAGCTGSDKLPALRENEAAFLPHGRVPRQVDVSRSPQGFRVGCRKQSSFKMVEVGG